MKWPSPASGFSYAKGSDLPAFRVWTPQGLREEHHVQTVFDPLAVCRLMEEAGFDVEIMTDFTKPGIQPGEKLFYAGRKKV